MTEFTDMLNGILDRARAAVPPAAAEPVDGAGFDPADHSVAEVVAYVEANPDEREAVLALEQNGKARSTLLAALTD